MSLFNVFLSMPMNDLKDFISFLVTPIEYKNFLPLDELIKIGIIKPIKALIQPNGVVMKT